ncbi:MAG: Flp pilus assembly complex ATPase component TadA [Bryobacterales bacterium]|nr:Flp pilus assembly complex ATPase component TadA [Bryobacterales bacterium]
MANLVNEQRKGWRVIGTMQASQASAAMGTIATIRETAINHDRPILETELPIDGSRFQGLIHPVVEAPAFAIRTRPRRVFTIEDYIESGILTTKGDARNRLAERMSFRDSLEGKSHGEILKIAIQERKNVLIVGSTGSGKTTLVNACLDLIRRYCPRDRVISIEDTMELQSPVENSVDLRAIGQVTMLDCLRASLRLKPKRIIVGEVRGAEALVMLKAWNTGHPGGVATVHANDSMSGLIRLQSLVAEGHKRHSGDRGAIDVLCLSTKTWTTLLDGRSGKSCWSTDSERERINAITSSVCGLPDCDWWRNRQPF